MIVFYSTAAIALFSTVMVITRRHPVHALLYFIVSLFSLAVLFFALGAPLAAAFEVIIYAGAIMVLFIFVIMLFQLGPSYTSPEQGSLTPHVWLGPSILSLVLIGETVYVLSRSEVPMRVTAAVGPQQIGVSLYGPYLLGVELVSMLLLTGLIGAYHLGRRERSNERRRHE